MSKDIFSLMKGHAKVSKPLNGPKPVKVPKNFSTYVGLRVIPPHSDTSKPNWKIEGSHLIKSIPIIVGDQIDKIQEKVSRKIAAFDFDGTIVKTRSGLSFARGPSDWQWFNDSVVSLLAKLHAENFLLVIFTNQGGVVAEEKLKKPSKSYTNFIQRVEMVIKSLNKEIEEKKQVNEDQQKVSEDTKVEEKETHVSIERGLELEDKPETEATLKGQTVMKEIDFFVFASPKRPASSKTASPQSKHDHMRKPGTGMWQELILSLENLGYTVDVGNSFFVGDAAGRAQDFLDSDKQFAENIGITFKEPEQIFKKEFK